MDHAKCRCKLSLKHVVLVCFLPLPEVVENIFSVILFVAEPYFLVLLSCLDPNQNQLTWLSRFLHFVVLRWVLISYIHMQHYLQVSQWQSYTAWKPHEIPPELLQIKWEKFLYPLSFSNHFWSDMNTLWIRIHLHTFIWIQMKHEFRNVEYFVEGYYTIYSYQ